MIRLDGLWMITRHRWLGVIPLAYLQNGSEVVKPRLGFTYAQAIRRARKYYDTIGLKKA
jgi:hypothetical protein